MAFTVGDFQDLLRLLEEHPEWRAELRRHVLTEEVLAIPALMQQLAERLDQLGARVEALADAQVRTDAQLRSLTARVETLTERLDQLTARVETLTERLDQLTARVETLTERLDQLTARVETLTDTVRQLVVQGSEHSSRLAELTGEVMELRYARRGPAYFSRLARGLRVLDTGRLADRLDDAVAAGQLTDAERDTLLEADLVLTGKRREDQEAMYVLVEVSYGIGRSDVQRASDRARLLEKLGQPVVAAVAGRWTDPDTDRMAHAYGVWQVLNGHAIPPAQAPSV